MPYHLTTNCRRKEMGFVAIQSFRFHIMQGKSFFKYTLDATSAGRTFLMSMNDRSTEKHQKIDALYKRVLNSLRKPIGIYFVPKENGYRT